MYLRDAKILTPNHVPTKPKTATTKSKSSVQPEEGRLAKSLLENLHQKKKTLSSFSKDGVEYQKYLKKVPAVERTITFRDTDGEIKVEKSTFAQPELVEAYRKNPYDLKTLGELAKVNTPTSTQRVQSTQSLAQSLADTPSLDLITMPSSSSSSREAQGKKQQRRQRAKVKCAACGAVGHMRTNRKCPRFQPTPDPKRRKL
jgi:hypothetical protein